MAYISTCLAAIVLTGIGVAVVGIGVGVGIVVITSGYCFAYCSLPFKTTIGLTASSAPFLMSSVLMPTQPEQTMKATSVMMISSPPTILIRSLSSSLNGNVSCTDIIHLYCNYLS